MGKILRNKDLEAILRALGLVAGFDAEFAHMCYSLLHSKTSVKVVRHNKRIKAVENLDLRSGIPPLAVDDGKKLARIKADIA